MIDLASIQRIYFAGIGGIGMSALARFFLSRGVQVSGYDRTETTLTRQLAGEGASIHYVDDAALADKDAQLVVYTPALPASQAQLAWYRQHNYPVVKRSEVLGIITRGMHNVCVAGTHGKTTISTMIAHVLRHTGYGCNAFLGGISTNYNTNFWSSTRDVCVVEADEYDRSFHKLSPDIAIITSMDADHLDIYGTAEAMEDAFVEFAGKVKAGGTLIRKAGLETLQQAPVSNQLTYSLDANSGTPDIYTQNLRITGGAYVFDAIIQAHTIQDVQLNMGGRHNVENALVAITVAHLLGIDDDAIRGAVAAFAGVKRRFEYVAKQTGDKPRVFIDDYAHHPEELRALVSSARELYPQLKCSVVFQPHLFTRTRDHAAGFAEVLQMADDVVLLPIYPARELPIPGITSELIAGHMQGNQVQVLEKEQWLQYLGEAETELLITAGAGDIDTLLPRALEILKTKMN